MSTQVISDRLAEVQNKELLVGSHKAASKEFCVMEAVAYVAGERWSDSPKCACPVISTFLRSWNDAMNAEDRNRLLKPLIPRLIDTRGSKELELRRSLMAADWLVRTHTVEWLRLAGLTAQADALASLPEITRMAQIPSIRAPIEAARRDASASAAWDAAWAAAGDAAWAAARYAALDAAGGAARDAAWDAAWDAAGGAARDAAWDAAWAAARDAAWDAAWAAALDAAGGAARDAAWDAAWDAARDAAWAKLKPTQERLQQSALELIECMIAAKDES